MSSSALNTMELSLLEADKNTEKLSVPLSDEDDVIIGRFRKISSAKSMAATNGNIQYPERPVKQEDLESGMNECGTTVPNSLAPVSKSSIRDVEKPSRFRDHPSATRFKMEDENTEESEGSGAESDDPLTATDTKYGKSFRHFTREALPRLDNYRHVLSLHAAAGGGAGAGGAGGGRRLGLPLPRPSLDELHNASLSRKPEQGLEKDGSGLGGVASSPYTSVRFGWVKGVLMRCLLNIWGVMLFLRLSWVVGQAGVLPSVALILMTSVVTTITALSMSAISTNGDIKGGGTYYMISRSLGPEFGGSIGLIFSIANAVACSMYVVGFEESLITLIPKSAYMIDARWDQAIYGCITIIILTGIVVVGMEWEAKAQIILLVILLLAIADFLIGSLVGPKSDVEVARGFVGYNGQVLADNLWSQYRSRDGVDHDFFSVFAIFFPAATGILAGANISGDLKDPQTSIPKGTLLAILLTTISYLGIALVAGWTVVRDATGDVADLVNGTLPLSPPTCAVNHTCSYGLYNSNDALCKDKLYPYLEYFGKGFGRNDEPVRGYVLTLIISVAFILMGSLDNIAPLISNFFLAAYTLINFATFHASLAKPVGWRPTFRYYNMWVSLAGAVVCLAIMFVISWITALITFAALLALYLLVSYRKPDVNWGSTTQAQMYKSALSGVQHLNNVTDHVKNYRPQILVLSGFPGERPLLADFAYLLTKGLSLMLCGHILPSEVSHRAREALCSRAYAWFAQRRVKAFYTLIDGVGFKEGATALIQTSGIGKLKPNIVMLGFKEDWQTCDKNEVVDYIEVLHKTLDVHAAIALLRVEGGNRASAALDADLQEYLRDVTAHVAHVALPRSMGDNYKESKSMESLNTHSQGSSLSDVSLDTPHSERAVSASPTAAATTTAVTASPAAAAADKDLNHRPDARVKHSSGIGNAVRRALGGAARRASSRSLTSAEQFTRRAAGTVDVWWLYDDGGLTLLLPYILSTRRAWRSCPLRVFTLANKSTELEIEERNMASLLSKFRIDYSALKIIPDVNKKPKDSTLAYFDKLIAPFRTAEETSDGTGITDAMLASVESRTHRHLRVRELIQSMSGGAGSGGARLVCVTLPMPRRRAVLPPPLYHAWVHALATAADTVLLVRGNHSAVLTFYS